MGCHRACLQLVCHTARFCGVSVKPLLKSVTLRFSTATSLLIVRILHSESPRPFAASVNAAAAILASEVRREAKSQISASVQVAR
jgi:hypothetical protein